jgi:hypothetical protein
MMGPEGGRMRALCNRLIAPAPLPCEQPRAGATRQSAMAVSFPGDL